MSIPQTFAPPTSTAPSPPALSPRLRPFTQHEYYRMVEMNLFQDQRVELIRGGIVEQQPMKNEHAKGIGLTQFALEDCFGAGFWVRVQMPLNLAQDSAPQPDLAVVQGGPRDFDDHPTTALLVVEVSDSTLASDRSVKGPLYASAGLPEYWIVNLVDGQLEVYRDPQVNAADPEQSRYGNVMTLKAGDTVSPLAAPSATIQVCDLLP